ncbi:MAG TPA: glycosyltransferase family A protein [Gaiellaceae bacterium]|nr:glycosyltransferase family A protein [Gaiellaceae bacterium]
MPGELPSFDLVVATVGRVDELERLLASLGRQTHPRFRVLVTDQNDDDRLAPVLAAHATLELVHLRASPGLSRARNAALPHVTADLVAFPDDDCAYPEGLLEQVAARFAASAALDGLSGRVVGHDGWSAPSWRPDAALLARDNLWNRANAGAIFLRRHVVERVGAFDERLGLGSGEPWSSGEEIDYLIRALAAGARIEYDPELTVTHDEKRLTPDALRARGYRDGASVGYLLRKHRYPARTLARMLVRPAGGAVLALARGDLAAARVHAATLRGRLAGYRGAGGRTR